MSQNPLNGAKMVVPESRKTHKFQACKSINPGWSYGGFSKAWKLPKNGPIFFQALCLELNRQKQLMSKNSFGNGFLTSRYH